MPSIRFTDLHIQRLRPVPGQQFEKFDRKVSGLGVRVSPGGSKAFFVFYRIGGRSSRLTLGRYPVLSLAEARDEARRVLSQVAKGLDPATEKIRARTDYQSTLFPTVLDHFVKNYSNRNTRSARETEQILRREFGKPWRKLPITQITKQTINGVLNEIIERGTPSAATHAFSAIRRLLNWCVEQGYLEHSPCVGMKGPCKIKSRDRVLSEAELLAIWRAAQKMGWPFGANVQLLVSTAQRRTEVSGLRWSDLDLKQGLWTQPAARNKSGRLHVVPLSRLALKTICSLPRVHDDFLFPARGKDNPLSGYSKRKRKLDELSGVRDWTLHDLRRTAATGMAALAIPPHVIERILNHTTGRLGGVAGIYNRFAYLPEMTEALERWSQHIGSLTRDNEHLPSLESN